MRRVDALGIEHPLPGEVGVGLRRQRRGERGEREQR